MDGKKRKRDPTPLLDRFATHHYLASRIKDVKAAVGARGGYAAVVAMFLLWDWCDGKTGEVKYMTVTRLAEALGGDRKTARECLKVLETCGIVKQGAKPNTWLLDHMLKPEGGGGD